MPWKKIMNFYKTNIYKHISTRLIYIFFFTFFITTQCRTTSNELNVPFAVGMQNNQKYHHNIALQHAAWKRVHELYNNYINNLERKTEPQIPKKIHQIWIGPRPFPKECEILQKTWVDFHPDWEYKLWTNEDIEKFGLTNKKLYDQSTNWGQKSDIARYEILYRIGGLYIDTDFECLHPFDILHESCNFYTGIAYDNPPKFTLFNGLIGSIPGHPILKECINSMTLDIAKDRSMGYYIMETTGPYYFTRCFLKKAFNNGGCIAFPVNYFYPWPNNLLSENAREQILKWVNSETFAIHHWHVSWAR